MEKFIFKKHKDGLIHILGNGRYVFYDYDKVEAMKPVIDKFLTETPEPKHRKLSCYKKVVAVDK